MNLDVDNAETFSADVDFDETGVDCLVELSEAGYETDGTCTGSTNGEKHRQTSVTGYET